MRVLITGGTGKVGKATTERLVRSGHEVRVLGIESDVTIPGAEYTQCDILNYAEVLERTRGCEGVIHLAAIPSPLLAPGHDVFRVNAAGTFNVFEAAAVCGIKRVVQASSINALGCFYGIDELYPQYFPVTEAHPTRTTDPYSFSKQVVEEIGDYYWRRDGISSVAMRFPGVYSAGFAQREGFQQKRERMTQLYDALAALPPNELTARITEAQTAALQFRAERPLEFDPENPQTTFKAIDDPLVAAYVYDRYNFWAMVDERDAAQSLEKGLTAEYEGAHPLFINDHRNYGYDARALIRIFFPHVPLERISSALSGDAALVSIEKSRTLIGFEPEHSISNTQA